MTTRCQACGAEQLPPMTLEDYLKSIPTPKMNVGGRIVECIFCTHRIPPGKPGRPPMTCERADCRARYRKLKAESERVRQKRGAA